MSFQPQNTKKEKEITSEKTQTFLIYLVSKDILSQVELEHSSVLIALLLSLPHSTFEVSH